MDSARSSLPEIIRNDARLYEGDLKHYFRVVFHQAKNLGHPYHNLRHMLHVTWLCHWACKHHHEELSPRLSRNILIAAMLHDFDHAGVKGIDWNNIERAVRGFRLNVHPSDKSHAEDIVRLIEKTEYPHTTSTEDEWLGVQSLRDADMAQALNQVWLQEVVIGLAKEWGAKPMDVLSHQASFHEKLKFHSGWGKKTFPRSVIDAKIAEAKELLALLS